MKISDYRGEEALDVLADILIPTTEILSDEAVRKASKVSKVAAVSMAIKNHKEQVIEILARLDGESPEEYVNKISLVTLPARAFELITDKELIAFFQSQSQMTGETSYGSATENIGGSEA